MLGGQTVGFASGESRDIPGRPRNLMFLAIVALIELVMAYGNTVSKCQCGDALQYGIWSGQVPNRACVNAPLWIARLYFTLKPYDNTSQGRSCR